MIIKCMPSIYSLSSVCYMMIVNMRTIWLCFLLLLRNCEIKSVAPYGVFVEIAPGREVCSFISHFDKSQYPPNYCIAYGKFVNTFEFYLPGRKVVQVHHRPIYCFEKFVSQNYNYIKRLSFHYNLKNFDICYNCSSMWHYNSKSHQKIVLSL